jgi:hypothetical protein
MLGEHPAVGLHECAAVGALLQCVNLTVPVKTALLIGTAALAGKHIQRVVGVSSASGTWGIGKGSMGNFPSATLRSRMRDKRLGLPALSNKR